MDFFDLKGQYRLYKEEIDGKIQENINNASFIKGKDVKTLEEKLAGYIGVKNAIGVASGTDALLVPLLALGIKPGDEVITSPFTFIATAEVIAFIGATPVFADIDINNYNIDVSQIEKKITKKTKAIIPVSLFGQPVDMDKINAIAEKHGLFVIEDGAQSFGAIYKGRKSCGLSLIGATSFYPTKPMGCYGDGGMIFTNDNSLAEKMRSMADHGQAEKYEHKYIGFNFRLDSIQAGVMLAKFNHFEEEAEMRFEIGKKYSKLLKNSVTTPILENYTDRCVFAQYSIRVKNRDEVISHLKKNNIPTAIHYPIPIHLQEAYAYLGYKRGDFPISEKVSQEIMSIPMHPFLTDEQIEFVSGKIKESVK